ncbi:putative Phosphatidylcholine-sterol acyltransferase [Blattamonas nauphoetae]|uniref:Phosphatidylcholine-sterol acyltransferase n=1 Tax=Blattamonas nauphoetae TaxID=2049346 RepID=A0ABQ9YJE6_9EUKA|nr:putative Phosphatidylcholine-sterol acyltransferase [Blattamonas nauphoetae]
MAHFILLGLHFISTFVCIADTTLDLMENTPQEHEFDASDYAPRTNREPVVLIPGLLASALESRKIGDTKYDRIWVKLRRFLPPKTNEAIQILKPIYNEKTNTYHTFSGWDVRPIDYGGVDGVTVMDEHLSAWTKSFENLINALKAVGYESRKDMFGAPWDWRVSTVDQINTNGVSFLLKELVERAYNQNRKKVVLVAHSCGGPLAQQFLNTYVTEEWKAKYISQLICVNCPFGGAILPISYVMGRRRIAVPGSESILNHLTEEMGCIYWMMPNPLGYDMDEPVATMKKSGENVTLSNIYKFMKEANMTKQEIAMQHSQKAMAASTSHPGVKTTIVTSYGLKTPSLVELDDSKEGAKWWKELVTEINGDGDGTVPLQSLKVPHSWKKKDSDILNFIEYKGLDHSGPISDKNALKDFVNLFSSE